MPRNQTPPSTPVANLSDKHPPITPIKILNRNSITKTTTNSQIDNYTNEPENNSAEWLIAGPQSPKTNKRSNTSSGLSPKTKQSTSIQLKQLNAYTALSDLADNDMETDQLNSNPNETKIHIPPPIFIKSNIEYSGFCDAIKKTIGSNEFFCKSNLNELKLQLHTPDSYRKVIHLLKDKNVNFHTYQAQQEKPFRIVIRNLHHTTDKNFIKNELKALGYSVVQVVNVLQWQTKKPLPLFFIDLEPNENNSEIFKLSSICYTKIKVEEPRPRNHIIQCQRCQNLGHTKTYCNHQPRCVKCSEAHLTENCQKSPDQPPKCALCEGQHPASYKGCPSYKDIQSKRKPFNTSKAQTSQIKQNNFSNLNLENTVQEPIGNTSSPENQNYQKHTRKTYSEATKNLHTEKKNNQSHHSENNSNSLNLTNLLTSFISELKLTINPLITLLTTVINKVLLKND